MDFIVLSLGSNLGNREKNLEQARRILAEKGIMVTMQSGIYETEPFAGVAISAVKSGECCPIADKNQPWFLNQVVMIETSHSPEKLLKELLQIEIKMGRMRKGHWEPRVIDLDLLFYGNKIRQTPELILPHPGISQRRFVLTALAEIMPDQIHPVMKKTMKRLLDECGDNLIVRPYLR